MDWVYAPTNGNREGKNKQKEEKEKTKKKKLEAEKLIHRVYGFLLKANRKLYIQTYRCVYISFSAWALNDVIAGIRGVNPEKKKPSPPPPLRWGEQEEDDDGGKNSRVLIRSKICVPYNVNDFFAFFSRSLFNFASIGGIRNTYTQGARGRWNEKSLFGWNRETFALKRFV